MITLRNDFHNSEVRLRASAGDILTKSQVNMARRTLCPIPSCTCGGNLGERGPQELSADDLDELIWRTIGFHEDEFG